MKIKILTIALIMCLTIGFIPFTGMQPSGKAYAESLTAEEILANMTLEEKVGQMFIASPDAVKNGGGSVTKLTGAMKKKLESYNLGGLIMFDRHIKSPAQIAAFNKALMKASYDYSGLPMFIAVDEEGGSVTRIAHNKKFKVTKFKSMKAIGKTGKTSKAKLAGKTIGAYLKKYGFTLDFAPVADTLTDPKNKVIGNRSFGTKPSLVSKMVSSEIDGFHSSGIMVTLKHYPGHGGTKSDTHTGTVKLTKSWSKLKKTDLIPFMRNLKKTDMVMASHIRCTGVSNGIAPTSLSKLMIQTKLRKELGYKGVVITDSMGMKAVSGKYGPAKASILAINAGCDIVLCPSSLSQAYNGVLKAVRSGEIPESRIDESVLRIIKLKLKYS
jgi:beta-N-acetylhexosaminidase